MVKTRLVRVFMLLAWLSALLVAQPGLRSQAAAPAGARAADSRAASGPAQPAVAGDALWDSHFALGANDSTFAAVFAPNGDLYVGGDFTTVAGLPANHVAHWTAATNHWSALGSGAANGVNNRVDALAIAGNVLYIGGGFNQAGGGSANAIAGWNINTQTWSTLNGGMLHAVTGPSVYALAVSGSEVYAGGSFDSAGGVAAQNIAHWNGAAWSALGGGAGTTNDLVEALAVSGSDVYAGGSFISPGAHIARYDGAAWSQLGSGVDGEVLALALNGGLLYAGGSFITATDGSPHTVNRIAQWNIAGTSWSALDTGLPMVLVPLIADQFYNAHIAQSLRLGQVVQRSQLTPANIRAAADEVLHNPIYRRNVERLQAEMHALPDLKYAVGLVERVAAEHKPVPQMHPKSGRRDNL